MNILVVCQYYRPEEFKINEICEALVDEGHAVTVLTGLPNYPSGDVPSEYRWARKRSELVNGVRVLRSFEVGRKTGALCLGLNYLSFMISGSLSALLLRERFDIVFVYQLSPVMMAIPGIMAKKKFGTPLFLYCCDLWPESMKNIVASENNVAFKVARRVSKFVYSNCDSIAVTSQPFFDYFQQVHDVPFERVVYIPQYAEDLPLMPTLTQETVTDFMFMGNIGIAQDIECILDAAAMLCGKHEFRIHFVGDGSYLKSSRALVEEKSLGDCVLFHGRHPAAEMSTFYEMADACLITLKGGNWVSLTMPSKLQGYLAAGKPVIGAIGGAAQDAIRAAQCGLCVDAGDATALAAAMEEFILNPQRHEEWGMNGRRYYESHFTKAGFMARLAEELMNCANGIADDSSESTGA